MGAGGSPSAPILAKQPGVGSTAATDKALAATLAAVKTLSAKSRGLAAVNHLPQSPVALPHAPMPLPAVFFAPPTTGATGNTTGMEVPSAPPVGAAAYRGSLLPAVNLYQSCVGRGWLAQETTRLD
jgi:hypothetical protein